MTSAVPGSKRSTSPMSTHSEGTEDTAPTTTSIAPLQDIDPIHDKQSYQPIQGDDPRSFDLVEPQTKHERPYSLEDRVMLLLSKKHLRTIFEDARLFLKFTTFLSEHRPQSIPLLVHYLDTTKALKAIAYSNAIVEGLEAVPFVDFTNNVPRETTNDALRRNASEAFAILTQEDLPAYITHVFVELVSTSLHKKITGTMTSQLREASEGLAEVFCITDMSKPDNPVIFTSEQFHRTTQYSSRYVVGRNCRFLQGPYTDRYSTRRLHEAVQNGHGHQDIVLNHRRDGSPFLNLLTIAPLLDDHGKVRYFIGAQVDVSGLVRNCANLEGLARLVNNDQENDHASRTKDKKDEFQHLCEMFNHSELETVRLHGGCMHTEQYNDSDNDLFTTRVSNKPRLLIREASQEGGFATSRYSTFGSTPARDTSPRPFPAGSSAGLPGIFAHYLILRPYPSLRIAFTSPSLRIPGLLQSPFLSRVGGSRRVREELALALAEGRNVTAKIRWLTERPSEDENEGQDEYFLDSPGSAGKTRWIHCTPLHGVARAIGVWVVIMVDCEERNSTKTVRGERIDMRSMEGNEQSGLKHGDSIKKSDSRLDGRRQQAQTPMKPSYTDSNRWNLDLDVAASESIPPLSSSTQSTVSDAAAYPSMPFKREFLGTFSLPPSPPPTTSIPPVPGIREILGNTTPRSTSLKAKSRTTGSGQTYSTAPEAASAASNIHLMAQHPPMPTTFPSVFTQNMLPTITQADGTSKMLPSMEPPPLTSTPRLLSRKGSMTSLAKPLPALDQSKIDSTVDNQAIVETSNSSPRRGFAHRMLHGFKKSSASGNTGITVGTDHD